MLCASSILVPGINDCKILYAKYFKRFINYKAVCKKILSKKKVRISSGPYNTSYYSIMVIRYN